MTLAETCNKIMDKVNEAGQQESILSTKLNGYQRDKKQAEAAKLAALEAKDEEAYKTACRAIADADAGIEFSTICLRDIQHKKFASDEENTDVRRNLNRNLQDIYLGAISEIEKAFISIRETAEAAIEKMETIDDMAQAWNESVMRASSGKGFCTDKRLTMAQYVSLAKARLTSIPLQKGSGK